MIKQIGEKWRGFWRMASNLALSMDADPLEDIHRRIKRLEAAVVQSEVGREPVAPSTSANQGLDPMPRRVPPVLTRFFPADVGLTSDLTRSAHKISGTVFAFEVKLFLRLAKQTLDSARHAFGDDFADVPIVPPSITRPRRKARFLTAPKLSGFPKPLTNDACFRVMPDQGDTSAYVRADILILVIGRWSS